MRKIIPISITTFIILIIGVFIYSYLNLVSNKKVNSNKKTHTSLLVKQPINDFFKVKSDPHLKIEYYQNIGITNNELANWALNKQISPTQQSKEILFQLLSFNENFCKLYKMETNNDSLNQSTSWLIINKDYILAHTKLKPTNTKSNAIKTIDDVKTKNPPPSGSKEEIILNELNKDSELIIAAEEMFSKNNLEKIYNVLKNDFNHKELDKVSIYKKFTQLGSW